MHDEGQTAGDVLMQSVAKGRPFLHSLLIALLLHVVLVALLSVPYFVKVATYGTLDVRQATIAEQRAAKEQAQEQRAAEKQKAKQPKQAKSKPEGDPRKSQQNTPERQPEVLHDRPADSSLNVDEDFGL